MGLCVTFRLRHGFAMSMSEVHHSVLWASNLPFKLSCTITTVIMEAQSK